MDAIWNFIVDNLGYISSFILTLGIVALYANKLRVLLRETATFFLAIDKALDDGKLDKEEILLLKNEVSHVWDAVKSFGKK